MTKVEQVFQAWAKQLHHHDNVLAFLSVILDDWNTNASLHNSIKLAFNVELRVLSIHVLQFDGNFFASVDIDC